MGNGSAGSIGRRLAIRAYCRTKVSFFEKSKTAGICADFTCGVAPKPIKVPLYMGHSQTANDWTVRAFDEIWDRLPPLAGCNPEHCSLLNAYVREAWIDDQVAYHRKKQEVEGRMRRRLARASAIVLPVTVAAAALHHLLLRWEPSGQAAQTVRQVHRGLHQGQFHCAAVPGHCRVAGRNGGASRAPSP